MKIFLKVKPKAKEARVVKVDATHYQVYVTQPLEKGKANKQIIKLLAEYFNVSSSKIRIFFGEKIREKMVEILFS
jgi:uncharacterized protein (TIGR00251 family)